MKRLSINKIRQMMPGDWDDRGSGICLIGKDYSIYYFGGDRYLPNPFWCYDNMDRTGCVFGLKDAEKFYCNNFRFKNFK